MSRAVQRDFFSRDRDHAPRRHTHGGSLSASKRKLERPLDRKRPIHIVLKSSAARERLSLLGAKNKLFVAKCLRDRSRQFHVTIHSYEIMGNHLHIIATFAHRLSFQNFLRTVTALIARAVTGARKGKPFGKRFWDHLAFTRVLMGRRDYFGVKNYLGKNQIEREYSYDARTAVEEYEKAVALARRRGCTVDEILYGSG